MPNYCDYGMKIKGTKENCYKWLDKMRDRDGLDYYEEENHFWRIFEADIMDKEGTDENYAIQITGYCAWSLESCCRASGYSEGVDLFKVNSKDLNITMEAYSEEGGCCFAEHYIYRNGECLLNECIKFYENYWDLDEYPTYADLKKEYPDAPSEQELIDNDYWWRVGGYEVWDYSI